MPLRFGRGDTRCGSRSGESELVAPPPFPPPALRLGEEIQDSRWGRGAAALARSLAPPPHLCTIATVPSIAREGALHGLLLAIALASPPAPAGPASTDEARRAFKEGAEAYQAGNYEQALHDFMLSYQLSQRGELLFDIAQSNRLLGHWAAAQEYYERYLIEVPQGKSHDLAVQQLAEVKQKRALVEAANPLPPVILPPRTSEPPPELLTPAPPPTSGSHPRPLALVLGGVGVAAGAVAIVGLVESVSFTGWQSQPPGSVLSVSSVQSRVDSANTWATVSLISAIVAAAGLGGAVLAW